MSQCLFVKKNGMQCKKYASKKFGVSQCYCYLHQPQLALNGKTPSEQKIKNNSQRLNLSVIDQKGYSVQFALKCNTKMKILMCSFCERQGINKRRVGRDLFFIVEKNGKTITKKDTMESLELSNNDTIMVSSQLLEKNVNNDTILVHDGYLGNNNRLNLSVIDQGNYFVQFSLRYNTKMKVLMYSFCERQGINQHRIDRDLFFIVEKNGETIMKKDTAESLGLCNDDKIKCYSIQSQYDQYYNKYDLCNQ